VNVLHFAFWPAVEAFERGDARPLADFVRDHALTDPEWRGVVADIIAGKLKRGDARKHDTRGEALARAYAVEQFLQPNATHRQIVERIAPEDFDAALRALHRYWRKRGRKPATPSASLLLEKLARGSDTI
jgi:hypothetical protein